MLEVRELVARRGGEMKNFRNSIRSPEILEDSSHPAHFRSIVALATADYQVSVADLAASLQVSEEEVMGWGDNSRQDLDTPSQDVRDIDQKLGLLN
jgi:hypothetical protein